MNNILIISEVFFPEEFLINDIINKWSEKGDYNIKVLTRNPSYPFGKVHNGYKNRLYQKETYKGIKIHRYHVFQGYKNNTTIKILNYVWNSILSTIIALIQFRKEKNIFVYHTGPLTVALSAILLKKINGAKVTIWTQDIWPDTIFAFGIKKYKFLDKLLNIYVKWVYKNCDEIIVSSPGFIDVIKKHVDKDIEFIPNWANSNFSQPKKAKYKQQTKIIQFTFAGNIGKVQNLERVIRAFSKWEKENVILNLYGDGSELANLKKQVKNNNIKKVKFWGRVPINEMPKIYERSNILIISLENDKLFDLYLPAKFSTYLSSGKPILGIISGVVKRLINENNIGFSCSPSDEVEIIEGLNKCYDLTSNQLMNIEKKSKDLYSKLFNSEKNIKDLENIIFNLQ